MLKILVGPSCSGKSTHLNKLKEEGYYAVRSVTTRPRRMGEDLSSYYFVTEHEYRELKDSGRLVLTEVFRGWYYGVPTSELFGEGPRAVVLTPGGMLELLAQYSGQFKDSIQAFYLGVDGATAESRSFRRGDDRREYLRRMAADSIDFRGFPKKNGIWEFSQEYIQACIGNPENWKIVPDLIPVERSTS